jgi:hypothetical protein
MSVTAVVIMFTDGKEMVQVRKYQLKKTDYTIGLFEKALLK